MSFTETDGVDSKIIAKGYMLKKCRVNGDSKPWKKRFFVLQGATLMYYRSANMAGAFKLFVHLSPATNVEKTSEVPWNSKESSTISISQDGKTFSVAVLSDDKLGYWLDALHAAKTLTPIDLPDQTYKFARGSTSLRIKMGLSAALASSSVGRRLLKSYMDDSSKDLIKSLITYAELVAGASESKSFEKGIFDIAARIAVIWKSGRVPPDLDLSLLHDETINFCQDFLMYSRDQRLKDKRGPLAEMQPLDMPELMRSSTVVKEMWLEILVPHVNSKVQKTFESISSFYFNEEHIRPLLTEPKLFELTFSMEKSLRDIIERY
eukprot:m.12375 g.12375  ORF g.12375 m.12375 type:complete len:321 (-) comp9257_c0_seq1:127-1089(-)